MALLIPLDWEPYRRKLGGELGDRTHGWFKFPARSCTVIASNGGGWEHASMARPDRVPTWEEMQWLKAELWQAEDCVVQFHPPASRYVNVHPFCLHLWRPLEAELPMPPKWMIG